MYLNYLGINYTNLRFKDSYKKKINQISLLNNKIFINLSSFQNTFSKGSEKFSFENYLFKNQNLHISIM